MGQIWPTGRSLLTWPGPRVSRTTPTCVLCSRPQIEANFGTDLANRPFRGDVAWIKHEAQQRLYASVLNTAVPRSAKVRLCMCTVLLWGF